MQSGSAAYSLPAQRVSDRFRRLKILRRLKIPHRLPNAKLRNALTPKLQKKSASGRAPPTPECRINRRQMPNR
ncbi:MAG: hypothetical protein DBX55_08350 [Verrucomicrobia bacterium]|nr:MAG: hypothetical protein DBX55_08350 [Verrucomicrobiota bacterium]